MAVSGNALVRVTANGTTDYTTGTTLTSTGYTTISNDISSLDNDNDL